MKVYIIRHGESVNNLKKHWTGWFDAALTEKGYDDARRAGKILEGVKFDRIFSSDLQRARETAVTAIPGCEPETSPLLREINVGSLADLPLSTKTPEISGKLSESGYRTFGGESYGDLSDRVRTFKAELESLDCEAAAVFTHAGWLRGFFDEVMGVHLSREIVRCGNCTVGIFEYRKGKWHFHSWINLV